MDGTRTHVAPRNAVVWSVLRGELERRAVAGDARLSVLDVGGGSGVFAVPLAKLGHVLTVVDTSPDALATLQRRAADAGVGANVVGISAAVDHLLDVVGTDGYDVVLCHSLLEMVDDPATTVGVLATVVRPGGCASLLVANRAATVLARALGGHPEDALRALTSATGRWHEADGVLRRFDLAGIAELVTGAGLVVERAHGVRVVADLVPGALLDGTPGAVDALRELELATAALPPYRDIATQLHVLARRA